MHIYINDDYVWNAPVYSTNIVVEPDEVQTTRLLGPDGSPYAIRRKKTKLGFDLTPSNKR